MKFGINIAKRGLYIMLFQKLWFKKKIVLSNSAMSYILRNTIKNWTKRHKR